MSKYYSLNKNNLKNILRLCVIANYGVSSFAQDKWCHGTESPYCCSGVENETNAVGIRCSPDSRREPGRLCSEILIQVNKNMCYHLKFNSHSE